MSVGGGNVRIYNDAYVGTHSEKRSNLLQHIISYPVPLFTTELLDLSPDEVDAVIASGKDRVFSECPKGQLRVSQQIGVSFMYVGHRVILGDAVGLGKTTQVGGLINVLSAEAASKGESFNYIFLTGKRYASQNRAALIRYTGRYAHLSTGIERDVQAWIDSGGNSLVASHSILNNSLFVSYLAQNRGKFKLCVIDESFIFRNSDPEISAIGRQISPLFSYFVFLNATLLETELDDVYNQFDILDASLLPNKTAFMNSFYQLRFGHGRVNVVGYKRLRECRDLLRLRYLARTRIDEGAEYSGNDAYTVMVGVSDVQQQLFKKTSRWADVVNAPQLVDRRIVYCAENVPKLQAVLDLADMYRGRTILVYAFNKGAQAGLCQHLEACGHSVAVLNGQTKDKDADIILSKVNSREISILITNTERGLDLRSGSVCIFYGLGFNPQRMRQVEGRIFREFDVRDKTVILLIAEGTKEHKYIRDVVKKRVEIGSRFVADKSFILDLVMSLK